MVSENESEFTHLKAEFTDSKATLNQFEPVRYWRQNFQSEFSDHFSNFQIFNILITLKIEKWQCSSDQRANVHVLDTNNSRAETMRNLKFPLTYILMHKAEFTAQSTIDRIY